MFTIILVQVVLFTHLLHYTTNTVLVKVLVLGLSKHNLFVLCTDASTSTQRQYISLLRKIVLKYTHRIYSLKERETQR